MRSKRALQALAAYRISWRFQAYFYGGLLADGLALRLFVDTHHWSAFQGRKAALITAALVGYWVVLAFKVKIVEKK